ncbi:MAG TPA: ATP-binding cassette domain-containing protein [Leptospiraceae bacterium]|nr:ATP-binding cassette domain-containing protein [Leptospiraceae bacterium]HMY68146.1 ATP-binding cassette domain-containing protein [Leptospiraceae bacterium]HNF13281.1 ATP-binding cassette domain-containing protein [Leptospiraceae bacterium]HNF25315.1 ATP-binding cassette domain-containing protein [Leptospiraceae bacterium]HNI25217.1 ATP-binding cassette domain-containing protein [Leptospiraceae bacterium]
MISVSNLTVRYGKKTLFEDVSIKFKEGERYGLIGANGSGKSTFLKILAGMDQPTSGSVSLDKGMRLGYLKQDHYGYDEVTIMNAVLMGNPELWEVSQERDRLYALPEMSDEEGILASEIEEKFADLGGYEAESYAGELLVGLGIPSNLHNEPMSRITGGFKLRVLLAQVLFLKPEILLLDEPTNHLDIKTISWLENFLSGHRGVLIVISHDRHFINSISTNIADLDYNVIRVYPGNYDDYMEASTMAREQQINENKRNKEKIAGLQEFVNRFSANASKAKQATSRQRLIEKLKGQQIEIKPSSRVSPYIRFKVGKPLGKDVINAVGISKSYGKTKVFEDVNITIAKGEKVAIIGTNGAGKTTLVKCLMKQMEPDSGKVEWGTSVFASYFPQDHKEGIGDDKNTLIDWLYQFAPPDTDTTVLRGLLGRMLFSGDMALKGTSVLSGGEKSRLIIARMIMAEDNVLALDEPTNHLDLESIESLNYALSQYEGTVLFVSHDREFVSSLATRIIEVTPERVMDFTGTYDEYLSKEGNDFFKRQNSSAVLAGSK